MLYLLVRDATHAVLHHSNRVHRVGGLQGERKRKLVIEHTQPTHAHTHTCTLTAHTDIRHHWLLMIKDRQEVQPRLPTSGTGTPVVQTEETSLRLWGLLISSLKSLQTICHPHTHTTNCQGLVTDPRH
jgi:hypothetical protein